MGKNPDVIEAAHMVLHLMRAGMAIYGYPAVAPPLRNGTKEW